MSLTQSNSLRYSICVDKEQDMAEETIFGYTWAEVQALQQKQRITRPITGSSQQLATEKDYEMLKQYGSIDALTEARMHGVVFRLNRTSTKVAAE
jgi:hypothetical protein